MNQFTALRTVAQSFMTDDCVISTASTITFDSDAGVESETDGTVVYAGVCRVRPSSGPQVVEAGEAPRSLRLYDVWLPYDTTGVELDHVLTVTDSDDPYMIGREFRITDVQGGSDGAYRKLLVEDTLTVTGS